MPIRHLFGNQLQVKFKMFSNGAYKQRVRIQVPARPSATIAGPGDELPAIDKVFEGSGEGNRNFGELDVDTGYAEQAFTILIEHAPQGSDDWAESTICMSSCLNNVIFNAEDTPPDDADDFNDTIVKAKTIPYFN